MAAKKITDPGKVTAKMLADASRKVSGVDIVYEVAYCRMPTFRVWPCGLLTVLSKYAAETFAKRGSEPSYIFKPSPTIHHIS